jgi:hypothetical protein
MANPYFRQVPDFEYISRNTGRTNISDYVAVKNLFKRAKIRDDIGNNLSYFTKYKIIGDDRPDTVAYKLYEDSTLDWVVLLSNNIHNVYTEWPLSQDAFFKYIDKKYGSIENSYQVKYYETIEVRSYDGQLILPAGYRVPKDYQITYYDAGVGAEETRTNIVKEVTFFEWENAQEDKKRNIFALKKNYLTVIFNDMDSIMPYKEGSTQYKSETLKRGENIRLYS